MTAIEPLRRRPLDELSGGQRQRAWIAMALAPDTGVLLLDEPTTYLDLAHQDDVLELVGELDERSGKTIVLVLHDLNQTCRYAHHLVAREDGEVCAHGKPAEVITAELVESVFGLRVGVVPSAGSESTGLRNAAAGVCRASTTGTC